MDTPVRRHHRTGAGLAFRPASALRPFWNATSAWTRRARRQSNLRALLLCRDNLRVGETNTGESLLGRGFRGVACYVPVTGAKGAVQSSLLVVPSIFFS